VGTSALMAHTRSRVVSSPYRLRGSPDEIVNI
jgi:hypothetical protein